MRILTKEQYQKEAEPLVRKIFAIEEMSELKVFASNVVGRVLLYSEDCYLSDPLLEAVVVAAENIGESGCYVSEPNKYYPDKAKHLYIPFTEFSLRYIEGSPPEV